MISKLKATVEEKTEKILVITLFEVISFDVFVPNTSLYEIGKEYIFYIAMLFSAEKGYILYGFMSALEKTYFLLCQDCHGIGPKIALILFSQLSLEQIHGAVLSGNKSLFESVSGIGKKKAELLVLELKSKVTKLSILPSPQGSVIDYSDFSEALHALGYNQKDIQIMIKRVSGIKNSHDLSLPQLLQEALKLS